MLFLSNYEGYGYKNPNTKKPLCCLKTHDDFSAQNFWAVNTHNVPRGTITKVWVCDIAPLVSERVRQIDPDQKVGLQCHDPLLTERVCKNGMSVFHYYIGRQFILLKNFIVQM